MHRRGSRASKYMTVEQLKGLIASSEAMGQFIEKFETTRTLKVRGAGGSLLSFLAGEAAQRAAGDVHIIVGEDRDAAAYLCNDLINLYGPDAALFFPTAFKRSVQTQSEDAAGIVQRTAVLAVLANRLAASTPIICTYSEAIAEKVVDPGRLTDNTLRLRKGEDVGMDFVEEILQQYLFEKTDFVGEPGQYSRRGGIIDIFSFADNHPYRLDFFGDTVESIRIFNIGTQLSIDTRDEVDIVPNLKNPVLAEQRVSLAEYIGSGAVTLWLYNAEQALAKIDNVRSKLLQELKEPREIDNQVTSRRAFAAETAAWRYVTLGSTSVNERPADDEIDLGAVPQPAFNKNFQLLADDIAEKAAAGIKTYVLTENYAQMERLENILAEVSAAKAPLGHVTLTLHGGFVLPGAGIALYTDHQIFNRFQRYTVPKEIDRAGSFTIAELNSLKMGDYVVHIDHGVGRFGGLVRQTDPQGLVREFVKLVYRDGDVLMVNIHSLHRISKYKDADSPEPKVHKLGSGAWQKLKHTAKSRVKDIARELTALYAKRKATPGFAYSPDSYLQQELEASFIYEDTPDQQSATAAVKADMEAAVPMDRLVCGDVGFGKTEIAVRAAFKAATDGKQVAVLVPTTILSLQHYRTFTRRLREFPVRIENFSRAKTARQASEILADLYAGKIDIIIGTHRLLGKNVQFHDLGLLIIDEEQKFGVANKERLRSLKANVDTLTLTATPIPRTLQFSLMGARDLSIINTPPPNRQPVETHVLVYNEDTIREALEAELQRGGQAFFLHNRVDNIESMAARIQKLAPEARIAIGHGQMPAEKLERVMMDFIYGEYDILIATTIIESGIDIPNANTIIINNAQRFGLSDLHQLRGRVGRTNRKAYCYLLIPPDGAGITDEGHRRLRAIEEFSDLGSGLNIAMQDLDIRGAGNILGAEQSGFVADIGFETYQKIMAEAVAELREEQGLEPEMTAIDCVVESDTPARLPDDYVPSTSEKLRLYREIDGITSPENLDKFIAALRDRFGEPPPEAAELFEVVRLRQVAAACGIERIVLKGRKAVLWFVGDSNSPFYKSERFGTILRHVGADAGRLRLNNASGRLSLAVEHVATPGALRAVLEGLVE